MDGPSEPAASRIEEEPELEESVETSFEARVDRDPGRVALRSPGEELTFDALDRRANRIAWSALAARGEALEPMALLVGRGPAAIAGILAAFKAGKISLFLDASLPRERLRFLLEDAGAGLLAGGGESLPLARTLAAETGIPLIDVDAGHADPASERRPGLHVPPDTPAYIIYTSGSAGVPKGVVRSHRNLLWNARVGGRFTGMTASDKALFVASPGAGQGLALFQALLAGAAVHPFDVKAAGLPALRDWMASEEITLYQSVPAVFRSLVKTFRPGESFPSLRVVRLGGDTVRREDVQLFQKHFREPCRLRVSYGSSETGPIASHYIGATSPLPSGPIPVGRPYEGVEIRLLDEDGREVGTNEVGEIAVRSRHLALGYWRNEALTRERFLADSAGGAERICRTGDLGQLRPDGLLVHRGRKDFQVKIRGNRVEVGEVEEALRALPGIEDAAVAGSEGPDGENRLVGYVVWKGRPGSTRELRAGLGQDAARLHGPRRVRLPRGPPADGAGKGGSRRTEAAGAAERRRRKRARRSGRRRREGARRNLGRTPQGPPDRRAARLLRAGRRLAPRRRAVRPDREPDADVSPSFQLHRRLDDRAPRKEASRGPSGPVALPRPDADARIPASLLLRELGGRRGARLRAARRAARARTSRLRSSSRPARGPTAPPHARGRDGRAVRRGDSRHPARWAVPRRRPLRGAVMAFEMARQLRAAGHEVGALVLLEPPRLGGRSGRGDAAFDPVRLRNTGGLVRKIRLYWAKWQLWDGTERIADLRRQAAKLGRKDVREGAGVLPEYVRSDVEPYVPREYAGRATLVLARHERFRHERLEEWQALVTGGLEVRVVPGIHAAIVQEPFVRVLAREVEECLAAAEAGT